MNTLVKFVLILHILGGSIGLVTGLISIIRKKGDRVHRWLGKVFFYSMMTSAFSALILSVLHPNYFLFVVGIFTLYMVVMGKRYLSRNFQKKLVFPAAIDWSITVTMMIAGIIFIGFGIFQLAKANFFGLVFIAFGFFGLLFVKQDFSNFMGNSNLKNYWLTAHLQRMVGSFIAALTAFLVVNANYFPEQIPGIFFWLFPSIILSPLIIKWSRKYAIKNNCHFSELNLKENIMKITITFLLSFLTTTVVSQNVSEKQLLDSAKTLFEGQENLSQEEIDYFDYEQIASLLKKAIEINPKNPEARYYLGYTLSRINSRDGRWMMQMNLDLVYQSSEQFEKVIELTPKYTEELIILDPYSKLTAEWGSLAMSYWYKNKKDSAIWAFREGRKRGGFGEFILEYNRNALDACSKNAILVSSGDNSSIPLWYLQIVEDLRTDVSVIDISLLNTKWYPAFLERMALVSFDLSPETLDSMNYVQWSEKEVTINNFSWVVHPSYYDRYLLRGDRIFLSLLRKNQFQRAIYFTIGFNESQMLSLKDYLSRRIFVDKLAVHTESNLTHKAYKNTVKKALNLTKVLNRNSQDELRVIDMFRYNIFRRVNDYLSTDEKKKARELMKLIDRRANESKYPYQDENGQKYSGYLRDSL